MDPICLVEKLASREFQMFLHTGSNRSRGRHHSSVYSDDSVGGDSVRGSFFSVVKKV